MSDESYVRDPIPCTPNTLLRYEDMVAVKPIVVEAYRDAIGKDIFDALLDEVRQAEQGTPG